MDGQLPSNYGQYLAWIGPVAIHLSVSSAVEHKNDDNNVKDDMNQTNPNFTMKKGQSMLSKTKNEHIYTNENKILNFISNINDIH